MSLQETQTDKVVADLEGAIYQNTEIAAEKDALLQTISAHQSAIATERDKILDTHKVVDPNEKTELVVTTLANIQAITEGVPEFIKAKRALMEDANLILNLVRSRFNRLGSLIGHKELKVIYPQTAAEFRSFHSQVELLSVVDDFNSQVSIRIIPITIPGNSGFARTLSLEREVDFSIGYLGDGLTMEDHGYFRLWHEELDRRNTRIVDVRMTANSLCESEVS